MSKCLACRIETEGHKDFETEFMLITVYLCEEHKDYPLPKSIYLFEKDD